VSKEIANRYVAAIGSLNGVNSVEVFVIVESTDDSKTWGAEKEEVASEVRKAGVVYFDGGSQCDYLRIFDGEIKRAVQKVYRGGGGIGGTSAGQAIQGSFIFDGCNAKTSAMTSTTALADPYNKDISFSYNYFNWGFLRHTITDQHVVRRNRIGRTLVFIARQIQDGRAKSVYCDCCRPGCIRCGGQ